MPPQPTLEVPGYEVMQYLGSGARSTIWQVRDVRTNELFALKRVVKNCRADARFVEQAVNEYNVAAALDHPAIRKIYKLRRIKRWFRLKEVRMLMELCGGQTVQEKRPTLVAEVVRVFVEVAAGLEHMNLRGYVHADMKPNNILVAPDGRVKIIDLGQSCRLGAVKERIQGTPDFIAPEQVLRRPLDARTDVFNFGAALYWALTGRPIPTVMPSKSGQSFTTDVLVPPPEQFNPEVPPPLSKLVTDCIEPQPSRRPAGMGEVGSRAAMILRGLKRRPDHGKIT
jgi:serine/threonine protein kinase